MRIVTLIGSVNEFELSPYMQFRMGVGLFYRDRSESFNSIVNSLPGSSKWQDARFWSL